MCIEKDLKEYINEKSSPPIIKVVSLFSGIVIGKVNTIIAVDTAIIVFIIIFLVNILSIS